jgi:hypothetical protein
MSYRPITDVMILTRGSLKGGRKYYGSYPAGFPERARVLIGAGIHDPVLHVCAGMAKHYKYNRGFGPNDRTLDLDPACEPDFLQDARLPFPKIGEAFLPRILSTLGLSHWRAILIDPPYSEGDAAKYAPGADAYPSPNLLVRNAIGVLPVGGRVGILHYVWPSPPKNAKEVALAAVGTGRNNRARWFTVFEKLEE